MQTVQRFGGKANRGIKSERDLGLIQVIIDRFRNRDQTQTFFRQDTCDRQRAVTADGNERVDMMQTETTHDLIAAVHLLHAPVRACDRILKWIITITRSKNGPAQMGDAADSFTGQRNKTAVRIFLWR